MIARLGTTPMWQQVTPVEVVERREGELPIDFKRRCMERQLAVAGAMDDVVVGRYTARADGTCVDDVAWGLAHERLPSDVCAIGWHPSAWGESAMTRAEVRTAYEERQRRAEEAAVDDVLRAAKIGRIGNKVWPNNVLLGDVIAEGLEWMAGTSTPTLLQLVLDAANGKDVKDAAQALIETCAQKWAHMEVDVSEDD